MGRTQKGGQKVKMGGKFAGSANFHRLVKFRRGCENFVTISKLSRLLLELSASTMFFCIEALNSN